VTDEVIIDPGQCTNWEEYELPAIWAMLESENEWVNALQAAAWNRTFRLLDSHRSRLQALKYELTERWPPETSETSRAILVEFDRLIDSVATASHAASGNALGLSGITDSLLAAKTAVQELYQRWEQKATTRRELTEQARKIIARADNEVYDHAQRLTVPFSYDPSGPYRYNTQNIAPRNPGAGPTDASTSASGSTIRNAIEDATSSTHEAQVRARTAPSGDDMIAPSNSFVNLAGRAESVRPGESTSNQPPLGYPAGPDASFGRSDPKRAPSEIVTMYMSPPDAQFEPAERALTPRATYPGNNVTDDGIGGGGLANTIGRGSIPPGRRSYSRTLDDDIAWRSQTGVPPVIEPLVQTDPSYFGPGGGVIGLDK
jgi:hypothetical protein